MGLIALIAQDASVVAVMVLANGQEGQGALVLYNFGWQMFFVPYAVLAVPIATTAFPVLAAAEGARFDETAAASTRAVMLVSWLGAALLAGAAVPASRLFTHNPGDARQLAWTFAAFAPGLIGYGLSTNLSRVLFADARTRVAAAALAAGWLLVIVADVVAVLLVPDWWVVPVLGLGNTIGLTVSGLALLGVVRRARGGAALRGTARAALAGLAGALAGAAAGLALASALPARGFVANAGLALLALRLRDAGVRGSGAGPGRRGPARGAGPAPGHAAGIPAGRAEAAAVTAAGTGAPAGLDVSYLLGTSAGGTGRHVAMLAGGCAARGATVQVYGPAATGAWLSPAGGAPPGWDFSAVDIADGPRPARDLAAVLRVRRLVARDHSRRPARARAPGGRARRPGPGRAGDPADRAGRDGAQRPARRPARPRRCTPGWSGSSPAGRTRCSPCPAIWPAGCAAAGPGWPGGPWCPPLPPRRRRREIAALRREFAGREPGGRESAGRPIVLGPAAWLRRRVSAR